MVRPQSVKMGNLQYSRVRNVHLPCNQPGRGSYLLLNSSSNFTYQGSGDFDWFSNGVMIRRSLRFHHRFTKLKGFLITQQPRAANGQHFSMRRPVPEMWDRVSFCFLKRFFHAFSLNFSQVQNFSKKSWTCERDSSLFGLSNYIFENKIRLSFPKIWKPIKMDLFQFSTLYVCMYVCIVCTWMHAW